MCNFFWLKYTLICRLLFGSYNISISLILFLQIVYTYKLPIIYECFSLFHKHQSMCSIILNFGDSVSETCCRLVLICKWVSLFLIKSFIMCCIWIISKLLHLNLTDMSIRKKLLCFGLNLNSARPPLENYCHPNGPPLEDAWNRHCLWHPLILWQLLHSSMLTKTLAHFMYKLCTWFESLTFKMKVKDVDDWMKIGRRN